jgi:1-phosphatidylinositol-3-phosphate 5-kinase
VEPTPSADDDKEVIDPDPSAASHLDDDGSDDFDGFDADSWSSEVRRKDTPRDLSLLSIRSLAKKKSDGSLALAPGLKTPLAPKPQAPSLELSLEQVEGKAQTSDRLGDLVKTISKATARDIGPAIAPLAEPPSVSRSSSTTDLDNASLMSLETTDSVKPPSANVRRAGISLFDTERSSKSAQCSTAPPSAFKSGRHIEPVLPASPPGSPSRTISDPQKDGWSSSMTSTFSNSFSQLLTMGSSVSDTLVGSFRIRSSSGGERASLSSLKGPLSKLSTMDNLLSTFEDKPHISFTYTIGSRLRMTCTVFYATAFDSLRRRCAIDKSFVDSLAKTKDWEAQGGKSKACFFKTSDDRYIIKELVSKWGASDT